MICGDGLIILRLQPPFVNVTYIGDQSEQIISKLQIDGVLRFRPTSTMQSTQPSCAWLESVAHLVICRKKDNDERNLVNRAVEKAATLG